MIVGRLAARAVLAAALLAGCSRPTGTPPPTVSQKVAGMSEHDYLACDGGPHLVLPKELSSQWKGAGSILAAVSASSDYGRACAATISSNMAFITVGKGKAIVLAGPPLS